MIQLICQECGKTFESERKTRQFCSRKCSIDNRKKDLDYIKKISKPKSKKATTACTCKNCNTEFVAYGNRTFCSTECSNKYKGALAIKETIICKQCGQTFERLPCSNKTFCSNTCVIIYNANDPINKQKLRDAFIQRSANPLYIQKLSDAHTKKWSDPEFREKMMLIIESDEWNDKVEKNSKKFKDYVFPSGKLVKVQGYENKALDILLQTFIESDIFVQRKEIENEIGKIRYVFNNTEHFYIPDIYIKSINKIIEVKSNWTYKNQLERNLVKEQSCKDFGFDFEFMIL
jgi:hypothetical protein